MKAILVLDEMPKNCEDCPLFKDSDTNMRECKASRKGTEWDYYKARPDWCPLKPIPDKKKERYGMNRQTSTGHWETYGEEIDSVAVGYNACIDEILGDKE